MPLLEKIRSLLGLKPPCPRCGEPVNRKLVLTVPADDRLAVVNRLLMLGRVRQEALRAELESLIAARLELPAGIATGVRVTLEFCPHCKHGCLEAELLEDGTVMESKRHAALSSGYAELDGLLGGKS